MCLLCIVVVDPYSMQFVAGYATPIHKGGRWSNRMVQIGYLIELGARMCRHVMLPDDRFAYLYEFIDYDVLEEVGRVGIVSLFRTSVVMALHV